MNVTEVIAELQKLPGHLPVAVPIAVYQDVEDGSEEVQYEGQKTVSGVSFQGRFVTLEADGPWQP